MAVGQHVASEFDWRFGRRRFAHLRQRGVVDADVISERVAHGGVVGEVRDGPDRRGVERQERVVVELGDGPVFPAVFKCL